MLVLKMPTALVTGINGFTGMHLVPELQRNGFVVAGIGQESSIFQDVTVLQCDLTDRKATINAVNEICPEVVIHLAGIAFAAHDDVDTLYRTNVFGTRNLLEALALSKCKPRAILLASSANIYGNAAVTPIKENTPPAPANDYAVSKLAMEYMARLWVDKLPIVIARPFNYTGRGQSLQFLLPKIVDHFKRRAVSIELGNLDVVRDFSDVRAVVRIYRMLIDAPMRGDVYNVCSGEGYSLQAVLSMMRELTGHDLAVRVNPSFVRENEIHKLIGSRKKLDGAIGRFSAPPLKKTLQWMLEANSLTVSGSTQ